MKVWIIVLILWGMRASAAEFVPDLADNWTAIRFQQLIQAKSTHEFDYKRKLLDAVAEDQTECFVELKTSSVPEHCMELSQTASALKIGSARLSLWKANVSRLCVAAIEKQESVLRLREIQNKLPENSDCRSAAEEKLKKLVYAHPEWMSAWPPF